MTDPKDDSTNPHVASPIVRRHRERLRRWPFVLGGVAVAIGVLVAVWDWNWFRPLIEREASAALGRPVTAAFQATARQADRGGGRRGADRQSRGVRTQDPPLAVAERLTVTIETMESLRHRALVVPSRRRRIQTGGGDRPLERRLARLRVRRETNESR
jgi:hypothetical protein